MRKLPLTIDDYKKLSEKVLALRLDHDGKYEDEKAHLLLEPWFRRTWCDTYYPPTDSWPPGVAELIGSKEEILQAIWEDHKVIAVILDADEKIIAAPDVTQTGEKH